MEYYRQSSADTLHALDSTTDALRRRPMRGWRVTGTMCSQSRRSRRSSSAFLPSLQIR